MLCNIELYNSAKRYDIESIANSTLGTSSLGTLNWIIHFRYFKSRCQSVTHFTIMRPLFNLENVIQSLGKYVDKFFNLLNLNDYFQNIYCELAG